VLEPLIFRSDPVLDFDRVGNFYYNSLKVVGNSFTTDVWRSTDGGMTWGVPSFAYGGDKQWMTIDRASMIGDGHIYQAWSLFGNNYSPNQFNRSVDGGVLFSSPIQIPLTPIWGTLDVSSDGRVFITGADSGSQSQYRLVRSTNARNPIASPAFDFSTVVSLDGGLVFSGGPTTPNPGGLHGQVWIRVDRSGGPTQDNIYIAASVDPSGADPLDVHFTRSEDGGVTWSTPLRVNDDFVLTNAWQWFATMGLAPNGRIDMVWNDTRTSGVHTISELWYSYSTDGGVTWAPNVQITPSWNSHVGWPNQNKIGDYYDIVSDDVGAHLAYSATFNGEQDVYYLRIGDYDCNANDVGDLLDIANGTSFDQNQDGIPDECQPGATGIGDVPVAGYELHQNTPNPFNPSTTIRFEVPSGAGYVRLRVFDVSGRLVRTLAAGFYGQGSQSVDWDGRDTSGAQVSTGVYFYRLDAGAFSQTRKMVFLK
jgi:hypothetical protein